MKSHVLMFLLPVALVAGCTGTSSDPLQFSSKASGAACTSIAFGGTSVSSKAGSTCSGCTVAQPENAIDGNTDSFATMTFPVSANSGQSLRVTAQPGVVYAARSVAAVQAQVKSAASTSFSAIATVRTFLGETAQEERSFVINDDAAAICGACTYGDPGTLFKVETTKPFDSVEFSLDGSFNNHTANVYEFCSDSQ